MCVFLTSLGYADQIEICLETFFFWNRKERVMSGNDLLLKSFYFIFRYIYIYIWKCNKRPDFAVLATANENLNSVISPILLQRET